MATANPLSYEVDALRTLMIDGGISSFGPGIDFAVQALALTALVAIATRLYPTLVNSIQGTSLVATSKEHSVRDVFADALDGSVAKCLKGGQYTATKRRFFDLGQDAGVIRC